MGILWQVNEQDVQRVQEIIQEYANSDLVQARRVTNLADGPPVVAQDEFWRRLVGCLLTTQQQSGPGSAVSQLIESNPFPLSLEALRNQPDVVGHVEGVLQQFGGIRRWRIIAGQVAENLGLLEAGLWGQTMEQLEALRQPWPPAREQEVQVANFIRETFTGFGPKQSRNLLQWLGLTRYEIPIDSRVAGWLGENVSFPLPLSPMALADNEYYQVASDAINELCMQAGESPCVLDAAIFESVGALRGATGA